MIKNYIKIALRNIKRQKIYSLITMSGLILGLSVFIMFALLSDLTSNFDSCHENASRIHAPVWRPEPFWLAKVTSSCAVMTRVGPGASTVVPLAAIPILKDASPAVMVS